MSAGDTDKTKPRKQFLNIVYFVESSRTRTLKIPMAKVHLLLFCALALVGWSVASLVTISLLVHDRAELVGSLKQSMRTVFDFESLYNGVYETAYPSGKLQSSKVAVSKPAPTTPNAKAISEKSVAKTVAAAVKTEEKPAAKPAAKPVQQVKVTAAAPKLEKEASKVAPESAPATNPEAAPEKPGTAVDVIVSNPVVKTTDERLNLTFDLTNKDAAGKSEGYIWATAEFKTDTGETHILKAPLAIDVNTKGEINDHKRASYFAIRRFKRNEFSFQLMKGAPGTVIGVKIGISDKPGVNKMIYDVPLGIKVGILKPNKSVPVKKAKQG